MQPLSQCIALTLLLQFWLAVPVFGDSTCLDKKIIGQESWVYIEELDMDFLARVDTGATSTSIHATDFMIRGETGDPRENIGKLINFLTVSTDGEYRRMEAEIARVQTVLSAGRKEKRYMIWLTFTSNGVSKKILANLRNRSGMKYKLLMGRDWLAPDFLVDVDMQEEVLAEEGEEE